MKIETPTIRKSTLLLIFCCLTIFPMIILLFSAALGIGANNKRFEDTLLGELINSDK
jgi:hypothetical protein